MNKESAIITPDVIEECLCESLDILEKSNPASKKNITFHRNMKKPLK